MYYVIDLANKLIQRGFRAIYANLSWVEFGQGKHGGWPDLMIGKNCKVGLVEVKGQMNFNEALEKVLGKNVALGTSFFDPKGAFYVGLAKDLGAYLFLAYFDKDYEDYMFIPVVFPTCSKGKSSSIKSILDLIDLSRIEEIRKNEEERKRIEEKARKTIKPLTLDDLEKLFK